MNKRIATIAAAAALSIGAAGAIGTATGTAGGGCQITGGGQPVDSCATPAPLPVCVVGNAIRPHACTIGDKARGGTDYLLVTTTS